MYSLGTKLQFEILKFKMKCTYESTNQIKYSWDFHLKLEINLTSYFFSIAELYKLQMIVI